MVIVLNYLNNTCKHVRIQIISFYIILVFPCSSLAGFAPSLDPSVGWSLERCLTRWKRVETGGIANVTVTYAPYCVRFDASRPDASWTLTVEPIWIDSFPICRLSYRAGGLWQQKRPVLFVRSGATGPVTPGAKNPENPLALRGEAVLLSGDELLPDGEWHDLTVDLAPLLDTHQIDQIVARIHPQPDAFLELRQLQFENPNLKPIPCHLSIEKYPSAKTNSEWEPVSLPLGDVPWEYLQALFDLEPPLNKIPPSRIDGIPFYFPRKMNTTDASSLQRLVVPEFPLNGSACEIAFLMGCRLYGTDSAWKFRPRAEIRQPDRLRITLRYKDGSTSQAFPWQVDSRQFRVSTGIHMYLVPVDPNKELASFTYVEQMSYGQIFLPWLSLHRSGQRIGPDLPPEPQNIPGDETPLLNCKSEIISNNNKIIALSDGLLELEIPRTGSLRIREIRHWAIARPLLRSASDRRLFTIYKNNREIASSSLTIQDITISENAKSATFSCRSKILPLVATVIFSIQPSHGIAMDLRLENISDDPCSLRVIFPDLRGLRLSQSLSDDSYCFPTQAAVISSKAVNLAADYGGGFPLQFMDLFSKHGGGLYLLTQDQILREKRYGVEKNDHAMDIHVEYGHYVPISLPPHGSWSAPRTLLGGHIGDWHAALSAYRSWSESWKIPRPVSRDWIRNIWICRRDYPLGGTGYLFDEQQNRYTFSALIAEGEKELGGIDMIDISGWAYSESRGRVGDYDCSELGGVENLREQIDSARGQGIRTGLYLEGYLVDERSRLIEKVGDRWQLIGPKGRKRFWPGNREMFMCPAVREWQDYFSKTYRRVAKETHADALYVDEYGFADRGKACYSDQHGHRPGQTPLIGEDTMLRRIRAALDASRPEVALYTEEVPCDVTAQRVDAAFCYGMRYASDNSHPTKINLFRYAFPNFKIIELFLPGIYPRASSEEDAKLAFFHGHAFWLKGRAASWYSRSFRSFVQKTQDIRHLYSRVFASQDCEPLAPTLVPGVYANRFSDGRVTIYTLYNSYLYSVNGSLLAIPTEPNRVLLDLWNHPPNAKMDTQGKKAIIRGYLSPHGLGCIAIVEKE